MYFPSRDQAYHLVLPLTISLHFLVTKSNTKSFPSGASAEIKRPSGDQAVAPRPSESGNAVSLRVCRSSNQTWVGESIEGEAYSPKTSDFPSGDQEGVTSPNPWLPSVSGSGFPPSRDARNICKGLPGMPAAKAISLPSGDHEGTRLAFIGGKVSCRRS